MLKDLLFCFFSSLCLSTIVTLTRGPKEYIKEKIIYGTIIGTIILWILVTFF